MKLTQPYGTKPSDIGESRDDGIVFLITPVGIFIL